MDKRKIENLRVKKCITTALLDVLDEYRQTLSCSICLISFMRMLPEPCPVPPLNAINYMYISVLYITLP